MSFILKFVCTTLAIGFIVLLSGAFGASVVKQQPSFTKQSGKSAAVAPDVERADVKSEQRQGRHRIKPSGAPLKGKASTTSIPVSPDNRVTSSQRPANAKKTGDRKCFKIPAGVVDVNITTRGANSSIDMIGEELRKDAAGKNYLIPKVPEAQLQAQIKADELSKCLGYNMSNTGHQCILSDMTADVLLNCHKKTELSKDAVELLRRIRRGPDSKGLHVLCQPQRKLQRQCKCNCFNKISTVHDRLSVVGHLLRRFIDSLR